MNNMMYEMKRELLKNNKKYNALIRKIKELKIIGANILSDTKNDNIILDNHKTKIVDILNNKCYN